MRKTLPASVAVAVSLLVSLPASAQMPVSPAFVQGNADRQSWETWFSSLSGEYQVGALFWSGQRSLPHPTLCLAQGGRDLGEWSAGCLAAQQRLALTDVRRKGEPDYRSGWNAWSPQIAPLQPMIAAALPSVPQPPATAFAPPPAPAQRPVASTSDEDGLNQIVEAAVRQYRDGQNDMQKGAARPLRAQAIAHLLPSRHVRDWIGTVTELTTNGDGKGVMVVQIGKETYVRTWNNALSDIMDNTLIDPLSSLFQIVSQLRVGQKVRFSGVFMMSSSDFIEERSLTLGGSISEPEFIMKFESVTPISDTQS
jgi:hypothetical protein